MRIRTLRTSRARASGRRKAGTGVLLLLGLFAGLIGFAPAAFAHHPEMGATVECGPTEGTYVVTVSARSWTTGNSGVHEDVDLYWGPTSVSWPSSSADAPAGAIAAEVFERDGVGVDPASNDGGQYLASNGYDFVAKFEVTTALSQIEVIAHADGGWGVDNNLAGNEWRGGLGNVSNGTPATLTLPTTCDYDEPDLELGAIVECVQGGISVTIENDGEAPGSATVTFTINGGAPQVVSFSDIDPQGELTKFIAIPENASYTLSFAGDFGGTTPPNVNDVLDCLSPPAPAAAIQWTCGANATVVLTNTGGESVTATITKNNVAVHSGVSVPGNHAVPITGADENTAVTIKVTFSDAGTATDVIQVLDVDCTAPVPTIGSPVCAAGGLAITLGNVAGTEAAEFTVVVDGNETTETVAPGATKVVLIPVAEDATVSVSITSGNASHVNQSLLRDCAKPAATVVFDCAEGGVVVTLTNTGTEAATVDVNGEDVVVAPGDDDVVVIPVAEGEAYDITVLGVTAEGVRDCEKPAATVVFDCAVGGVSVSVTNTGELPTTVNVSGNPVVVNPGVPYNTVIPVAEGAAYDVTVTGDEGLNVGAAGTRDCEKPALASVTLDCAEGGVVVVLTNTGALPAEVTVDGDVVVIPAGGETSVVVPVAENATYGFDIVIDGVTTIVTGERDCEQPGLVSALVECAEGGVVVVLSNTGVSATTVTVDGDEVNVPAGATVEVLVPVEENATYDFLVEGDELSEQVSGTLDCEIPVVESIQIECAEGGVVVIITNDGETATTVTVDGIEFEIPAGATVETLVEIDENEDYSFLVEGDGIEQLVEGTYDCDLPEPTVDDEVVCAAGGLNAILRNAGDDTATFLVTSPALADGAAEVVVEAGGTATVLIPLAEEASTEVVVTSGGETIFDETITRACEEVEGDTTKPPTEVEGSTALPRTGSDTNGLLALAGALLLAGAALVAGGRRKAELA